MPSSSPRETLRSVLSWKRWHRSLRLRRQARLERRFRLRQERAALLLNPLWEQHLAPQQQLLQNLLDLQWELQRRLAMLEQSPSPELAEHRELLLEILSSLQPRPEAEIAQRLGLPLSSPSSPSSTS